MLNIKRVCIKNPSVKNYLNKHISEQEKYPDIGRKNKSSRYPELLGSPLANPFYINRDEVVEKYRRWLWEQVQSNTVAKEELSNLLKNIRFRQELNAFPFQLACWCKSHEKCHGDIIINCLNWMETNHIGE